MAKKINDVQAVFVCNLSSEQPFPTILNCQMVFDALDCLKVASQLVEFAEFQTYSHENEGVKHMGGVNTAYSINML